MFKNLFANLQKVGKALMLPVSVLPVAGILLGVGAAHLSFIPEVVSNLMEQAGGSVFGQMALLFAVGVALGFTNNDGPRRLLALRRHERSRDGEHREQRCRRAKHGGAEPTVRRHRHPRLPLLGR